MREFDRVVTDYKKLGGLPHFRDTNITVSAIVRMVMADKSNADILAHYPELQPEDIQEALALAISNLVMNIGATRFDLFGKMSSVIGALGLLSDPEDFDSDERIMLAQMADENAQTTTKLIYDLQEWSRYAHLGTVDNFTSIDISDILTELINSHNRDASETTLKINTPDVLPEVRADHFPLFAALRAVTAMDWTARWENTINLTVQQRVNFLTISVRKLFQHEGSGSYRFTSFIENLNSSMTYPSKIAIAALIIHQHGSELKIMPDEDGVTFEFELPVWQDEET